MAKLLTRGYIAKILKINPETIRYYESQKLIKKPIRLANNYRIYEENDIVRIKFILIAKNLGFSLKEIKDLLNLSLTEKSDREKIRSLAIKKSEIISEKLIQLTNIKKTLDELITLCYKQKSTVHCPILKWLYTAQLEKL